MAGALLFAAAHHVGPYGEAVRPYVFLFRAVQVLARLAPEPGTRLTLVRAIDAMYTPTQGLVSADLFQKIVFGAAVDARRDAQSHPWRTTHLAARRALDQRDQLLERLSGHAAITTTLSRNRWM